MILPLSVSNTKDEDLIKYVKGKNNYSNFIKNLIYIQMYSEGVISREYLMEKVFASDSYKLLDGLLYPSQQNSNLNEYSRKITQTESINKLLPQELNIHNNKDINDSSASLKTNTGDTDNTNNLNSDDDINDKILESLPSDELLRCTGIADNLLKNAHMSD